MGKRGPKPEPHEVKLEKGSWRAKGKEAEGKVRSVGGDPAKPGWLAPDASEIWDEMLPILQEMRVIDLSNSLPFDSYCEFQAQMNAYNRYFAGLRGYRCIEDQNQQLFDMKMSTVAQTQLNAAVAEVNKQVSRYLEFFGLTPSSRGTIEKVRDKPGALKVLNGRQPLGVKVTG